MTVGATWSYHPPQSSHAIKMAVLDQYGLLPMALTIDATQDGPEPSVPTGWSDACPFGITQLTAGSWPFAISVNTRVCCRMTLLVQSGPVHTVPVASGTHICRIALGPVQIVPADGV